MLKEKVEALNSLYKSLMHAHQSVEAINKTYDKIEETCKSLKSVIDSNSLSPVDNEIQAAISAVYKILEETKTAMKEETVNLLLNPKDY